jgi:hypothetical protein
LPNAALPIRAPAARASLSHQTTRAVDGDQTRAWQAFRQSADQAAMRPVVGVWVIVQSNPQTGAVSTQHWTYEASGLWVNFSDLNRTDACVSSSFRFQDRNTIVNAYGGVSRRVQ